MLGKVPMHQWKSTGVQSWSGTEEEEEEHNEPRGQEAHLANILVLRVLM